MSEIRHIAGSQHPQGVGKSGEAMDRKVERKTPMHRKLLIGAGVLAAGLFAWWIVDTISGGRSLSVNSQRIVVSDVTVGMFEDFVPLRGRLVPKSTVFLDAIEGGRV